MASPEGGSKRGIVDVAAAVIFRPDGAYLLGRRPSGGVYAGYWEFPGGKIEAGESPHQALDRELHEELGITVGSAVPWIVRKFSYEHAQVRLHFFRVLEWSGELRALQHDALEWWLPEGKGPAPMLPANGPVLAALALPDFYAISHAGEAGINAQLGALRVALGHGLRLLQLREAALPPAARSSFVSAALELCRKSGARVLINGDDALARDCAADGIHLTAARLMQATCRPKFPLVAASCHDAAELAHAENLGLDFVVVGPVNQTASHPEHPGLGWTALRKLLAGYSVPAYALGGLAKDDMPAAWRAGAHGIAAIRSAWR